MVSGTAEVEVRSGFLAEASGRAHEMLDTVEAMFDRAVDAVCRATDSAEARETVFKMDAGVDAAQRDIRRALVMHLTANPIGNPAACLALMVVAKDAERAGDYCKNLAELTELAHGPLSDGKYGKRLLETFSDVKRLFAPVRAVLEDPSTTLIRLLTIRASDLEERCSWQVRQIANDGSLSENEAVCLALAFRGCRRISAHLSNTACAAAGLLCGIDTADLKVSRDDRPARGCTPAQRRRLP